MVQEVKNFDYKGLKPLEVKDTVVQYITQELDDFKDFLKHKVEPLKIQVMKLHSELDQFKSPILTELINIRKENEALLRELSRQKGLYREMLGEFYKMVAINESVSLQESTLEAASLEVAKADVLKEAPRRATLVGQRWNTFAEESPTKLDPPELQTLTGNKQNPIKYLYND